MTCGTERGIRRTNRHRALECPPYSCCGAGFSRDGKLIAGGALSAVIPFRRKGIRHTHPKSAGTAENDWISDVRVDTLETTASD